MGSGSEVNKKSKQGTDEGNKAGEGEIPPRMAASELTISKGSEGIREYMDQRGRKDNSSSEALNEEQRKLVSRTAMEDTSKSDGGRDAERAGDEDDADGDELEVGGGGAVAAEVGARGVGEGARRGRHGRRLERKKNSVFISISRFVFSLCI